MSGILKFSVFFVICSLILGYFDYSGIFSLFGSGINYVTTGNIAEVIQSFFNYIGTLFDWLFIDDITTYTTHFGGLELGSMVWVTTIVRVVFAFIIFRVLLKFIID